MRRNFFADEETERFIDIIYRLTGKSVSQIIRDSIIDAGNRILIPSSVDAPKGHLPYFTLEWPRRYPRLSRKEIRGLTLPERKRLSARLIQRAGRDPYFLKCVICNNPEQGFDEIHLHHENYDFPERVTPLCRFHHAKRHVFLRSIQPKYEKQPMKVEVEDIVQETVGDGKVTMTLAEEIESLMRGDNGNNNTNQISK